MNGDCVHSLQSLSDGDGEQSQLPYKFIANPYLHYVQTLTSVSQASHPIVSLGIQVAKTLFG